KTLVRSGSEAGQSTCPYSEWWRKFQQMTRRVDMTPFALGVVNPAQIRVVDLQPACRPRPPAALRHANTDPAVYRDKHGFARTLRALADGAECAQAPGDP